MSSPALPDAALSGAASLAATLQQLNWEVIATSLNEIGYAILSPLLSPDQCRQLIALYGQPEQFRKRVIMERHGYGQGEYQYFAAPLPDLVTHLRTALYPPLAEIANHWNQTLKIDLRYPTEHSQFLERCHQAGQQKPTPLLLKYEAGDFNCLHQDLYGEHVFPLQVAILLSKPGDEFTGGEFVLTEQRMRRQSRIEVVPLHQGQAVLFPVYHRPIPSKRGFARASMRHGVSRLHSGQRWTLGVIFHDAL